MLSFFLKLQFYGVHCPFFFQHEIEDRVKNVRLTHSSQPTFQKQQFFAELRVPDDHVIDTSAFKSLNMFHLRLIC